MRGRGRVDDDVYVLPDPQLRSCHRGVGILSVGGVLRGHLACVVGRTVLPSRQPWPWFVIVWVDGTKERAFEDCGPSWWTVRELDAGRLQHWGPTVVRERRVLGRRFTYSTTGDPCVYDFAWLEPGPAAAMWSKLGLVDSDF